MSSIFRKDDNYVDKPKRNTFDLSHQNNLTLKMGELVPVLCQEVLPGDSFKIDPVFALRYMPQVFPVQTRQRASIKYYYVRNRPLWKDWMDFIGKTKSDLVSPYIKFSSDNSHFYYLRPSSLADYMGVPIKISVPYGETKKVNLVNPSINQGFDYTYIPNGTAPLSNTVGEPFAILEKRNIDKLAYFTNALYNNMTLDSIYGGTEKSNDILPYAKGRNFVNGSDGLNWTPTICDRVNFALLRKAWKVNTPFKVVCTQKTNTYAAMYLIVRASKYGDSNAVYDVAMKIPYTQVDGGRVYTLEQLNSNVTFKEITSDTTVATYNGTIESIVGIMGVCVPVASNLNEKIDVTEFSVSADVAAQNGQMCWCDVSLDDLPFCSVAHPDRLRISAIPFRAIEALYNALVRNAENNPFKINGIPEYNKYNISTDGGAITSYDNLLRTLHCNWSDDRFTTALPSPQQGDAPLVGLTGVNGATLTTSTEDGTTSTLHLQVDSDTGNVVFVDGVSSDSPDYLSDAFMSAVEYGITINDLRNVNSFQRWLENNIRKGYKYKDQLMSHYGVSARYDVLDMPEFIGGVARDVNVEQITQTVENEYANLGEYGGNSYIMGQGHSIEHYCDEHGFIIGLLEIKPMPLYQDALPKYLVKTDPFDYYFPEFGKIGMQPISCKELAFSQSWMADKLDSTFGYQRAWYDYLENLDTVHGSLRFDLRNFLIARDFGRVPTLGDSFLTVDSDDVNNTFYSNDDEDKIIGQIYHKMTAKRPIPMVGIPALE